MRKWKGYGFFVAMAAIILIAMISSDFMSGWTEENYTYTQFKDDLSNHKIQSVVVGQNEQVPTGEIRVTMKDSKKHSFYAPDVNVVIEKLDDAHFTNVVVYNDDEPGAGRRRRKCQNDEFWKEPCENDRTG